MKQAIHNEKGMVLIGILALLAIILLLAGMAVTSSYTDIKISNNYRSSKQAFYVAEAGVQHAKAVLKTVKFNDVLNGTYSGSLSFGTDTLFVNGAYYNYYYNVKVEDNDEYPYYEDPNDPTVDNDNIVYIKSIGSIKKSADDLPISMSNVELKIEKTQIPFPPIPGAVTIIGEANTDISDSMNICVDGRDWLLTDTTGPTGPEPDKYAIALSNIGAGESTQSEDVAIQDLDTDISELQAGNFAGRSAGPTESIGLDNVMTSQDLQAFVDMAKQVADNSLMVSDVSATGITGSTDQSLNNRITIGSQTVELGSLGSLGSPKITYFNMKPEDNDEIDRVVQFNSNSDITGSGILIVEGNDLKFLGSLSWTGIIIVIGDDVGGGLMAEDGSKEQTITGAFIVDEQDSDIDYNELVLTGNVNILYSSEAVEMAQSLVFEKGAGDIKILTWRQILN